jgi:hypothetical protein
MTRTMRWLMHGGRSVGLNYNALNGTIPSTLGALTLLQWVHMPPIPLPCLWLHMSRIDSLMHCILHPAWNGYRCLLCLGSACRVFQVWNNALSGSIPSTIGSLTALTSVASDACRDTARAR